VSGEPHDPPSALALLEATREFIAREVAEATEGRLRFHARVAANVLSIVERELAAGDEPAKRHRARLASLGVASEAELAAAIRAGTLDERMDEVKAVVRATVEDKLAVANPGYSARPPPG
jgi:Domain of unknown function (DUF6285)